MPIWPNGCWVTLKDKKEYEPHFMPGKRYKVFVVNNESLIFRDNILGQKEKLTLNLSQEESYFKLIYAPMSKELVKCRR